VVPCRAKRSPLHVRRSCFAPTESHRSPNLAPHCAFLPFRWIFGGGAGYRPRVRSAYCVSVYRHSRLPDRLNIVIARGKRKMAYRSSAFRMHSGPLFWRGGLLPTQSLVPALQGRMHGCIGLIRRPVPRRLARVRSGPSCAHFAQTFRSFRHPCQTRPVRARTRVYECPCSSPAGREWHRSNG